MPIIIAPPTYRWDDLVVGAPFYWDRITPELGRVYVFYNVGVVRW